MSPMPKRAALTVLAALSLPVAPGATLASSDEAWQEFRAEVEAACTALIPDEGGETVIEVNPFGSESYGAALLITTLPDGAADRFVCIYDKQTKAAELTAPFLPPAEMTETVAGPDGTIHTETLPHTDAELVKP